MDLKFSCINPVCQQHIAVDPSMAGRAFICPKCGHSQMVPGERVASILSSPAPSAAGAPAPSVCAKPLPMDNPYSFGKRLKRLLGGWAVGAAVCGLILAGLQLRLWASLPKNFDTMQREIGAVGDFRLIPWANHDNSELMYARNQQHDLGSFLVDLGMLRQSRPRIRGVANSAGSGSFGLLGWSPDDKYMVFSWTLIPGQANRQVAFCDGTTSAIRMSFALPHQIIQAVWLTTNSMAFIDGAYTLQIYNINPAPDLGKFGKKGLVFIRKVSAPPGSFNEGHYSMVRVSETSVAFVDKGNIWTLDLAHNKASQLTEFQNQVLEWLSFSPESGWYLFILTDKGGPRYRRLYLLKPDAEPDRRLVECSPHDNIFKGLWALNGQGVTYVDNLGSENCLAVDTKDSSLRTNLFVGGHIRSYSVSPNGQRIYAIASTDDSPMGIWEYDITAKKLRNVAPALSRPFAVSKLTAPVKTSVNGMGYFFLAPVHLDKQKKYPLVIDATRDSRWDAGAEILANSDIFYAAVNRYGLANFVDYDTSPSDMMQLYQELLKNPNVDPARVYLAGTSAGARGITTLINSNPSLWRGAGFMSAIRLPGGSPESSRFPSIFISAAMNDQYHDPSFFEKHAVDFARREVPVTLMLHPHEGHILSTTDSIRQRWAGFAEFILLDK